MPTLSLDFTADTAAAVSGMGDVGAAARGMASDVSASASSVDAAAGRMDAAAEAGDNLASKSSQATGAMGALAGGLEAVGLEKYAAGMQAAAIGTDFASGAGDALNLVMETQAGRFIAAKVATVGHAVATGAQTVATGVATAAQWAWNAALAANPIGLAVVALALLAGGIALAYAKVGPFRDVVDTAFGFVKDLIGQVSGSMDTLVGWVGKADDGWDAIKSAADSALGPVKSAVGGVSDALETAVGWVQDLIEWISKIDMPSIDVNPFNRTGTIPTEGGGGRPTLPTERPTYLSVELTMAPQDQDRATRDLIDGLRDYLARRGQTLSITQ